MSPFPSPLRLHSACTQATRVTFLLPPTPETPDAEHSGSWKCCQCHRAKNLHLQHGLHPLGTVTACECSHKPCDSCTFSGDVSYFTPISEPLLIPIEAHKSSHDSPYGIICGVCGLSWRAKKIGGLRKMPSLYLRGQPPGGLLRKTQSISFFGAMKKNIDAEKGVKTASVRFTGIKCTCGALSDYHTIGFKIADGVGAVGLVEEPEAEEPPKPEQKGPKRYTDERLLAKGHDAPYITIGRVQHPNPLRSAPVEDPVVEAA